MVQLCWFALRIGKRLRNGDDDDVIIIIIIIIIIIEIQRLWDVKAKVILVIKGATGTISKALRQYMSNIPGKHEIKELLGTAHMLRNALMYSKGKSVPLQAWTGPEGSRRLSLPHFKTVGT